MSNPFNWHDELAKIEGGLINRVEAKVKAATTAATLTGLAVSLLGLYVFHGVVPDWVTATAGTAITGALTFISGYLAKHTPRVSDLLPPVPPVVAPPLPPFPGDAGTATGKG